MSNEKSSKYRYYRYVDIKPHINEGDVLLFRGQGLISKLIGSSSESLYSHVGIASWINGNANTSHGILECVEFREGSLIAGMLGLSGAGSGRSVNLYQEVKKHSGRIDVYRPNPVFYNCEFNSVNRQFVVTKKKFDGKKVTTTMRQLTGRDYDWNRIWWMFKHKLLIWKIFGNFEDINDDSYDEDVVYPVCSTSISYAFHKNGFDLVKNKSYNATEPGHIAMSSELNYLGTLQE